MVLSSLFHKKTTKPIMKNEQYEFVHPFKCRIANLANLAKLVFKILAFTFLYEIGYFSAKTTGDATIFTNLNSTYIRMFCVQKLRILFSRFREDV